MSISRRLVLSLIASGTLVLHRDELREMTRGLYSWAGANAGLFGGRHPLMESDGELRRVTAETIRNLRG